MAQVTQFTARQATYTVRTAGNPAALAAGIRNAVKQVDPNLPVTEMRTQTEQTAQTFAQEKLFAQLTSFFGLLTLGLVGLGLYGMMSYSVAQRRREMGIRLALGAPAGALMRMVLRQGLTVVLLSLGLEVYWPGGNALADQLFIQCERNKSVGICADRVVVGGSLARVLHPDPTSSADRSDDCAEIRVMICSFARGVKLL